MKNKNILYNNFNYIQYTEPNLFHRINFKSRKNNNKDKNYNHNIKNLNKFRSETKINNANNHKNNYLNRRFAQKNDEIFDMRIYFCLKMLGLSHLQNILEKNNINFDELLIMSIKDLESLNIKKNEQLKIKQFSLDYIKQASYYSLEELEKYFKNIKNKKNYRKAISVGNMRKNNIVVNRRIPNNNYTNMNNNKYNSYTNFFNNAGQHERYKSSSNFNNNMFYIYKNKKIHLNNNIYENNNINPNYNSVDFFNNKYSNQNNMNMNYNKILTGTNDKYFKYINLYPSNYSNCNKSVNNKGIQIHKNNVIPKKINKYRSKAEMRNSQVNRNKKIGETKDSQKKIINKYFTNKMNSIKNRKINKNINNEENINNAQFINEKEYNMFSQIQKLKKNNNNNKNNNKQKISNRNITNTKINNYINNFYNINKNNQENKLKNQPSNSYRNKLIIHNELFDINNNMNNMMNINKLTNRNYTLGNNGENCLNSEFDAQLYSNYYYFNNKERNMTLSNENRYRNSTFKNNIMLNDKNRGSPY